MAVSAGTGHSLALGADGLVRSWGLGHIGPARAGRGGAVGEPAAGARPHRDDRVVAGGYHSLAVRTGGTVSSWGWNAFGQLGDGSVIDRALAR